MNKNTTDQLGDLFAKTPDGMKGTVAYVMATTAIGTLMRMLDSLLSHTRQGTAEERLASAAVHDLKVDLLAAVGKFEEACKAAEGSRQEKMKEEFAEKLPDVSMCRSETRPFLWEFSEKLSPSDRKAAAFQWLEDLKKEDDPMCRSEATPLDLTEAFPKRCRDEEDVMEEDFYIGELVTVDNVDGQFVVFDKRKDLVLINLNGIKSWIPKKHVHSLKKEDGPMCRSEAMPEEKKFKSGEMVTIEGIIGCFLVRDQNGENVLVTMDGKKVWMHVSLISSVDNNS